MVQSRVQLLHCPLGKLPWRSTSCLKCCIGLHLELKESFSCSVQIFMTNYCHPPPPPPSRVCYIASVGEMLVRYARPPSLSFGAMAPALTNFLLSNLYATFQALGNTYGNTSCLGGMPAAAVNSPVLFLAPILLLVQAPACKSFKMSLKLSPYSQSIVVHGPVQSPGFTLSQCPLCSYCSFILTV